MTLDILSYYIDLFILLQDDEFKEKIEREMSNINKAFSLFFIKIKMSCIKIISFFPFYARFKENLKTPYLGLYYPLRSAIVSVNLRFMGVFLIFFILFFIILFFINYIFYLDSPDYFINIFGTLILFSLWLHILTSIKHLLLTAQEYVDLLDEVVDELIIEYNYMEKIFYERKYDEKLIKFKKELIIYIKQKIW